MRLLPLVRVATGDKSVAATNEGCTKAAATPSISAQQEFYERETPAWTS